MSVTSGRLEGRIRRRFDPSGKDFKMCGRKSHGCNDKVDFLPLFGSPVYISSIYIYIYQHLQRGAQWFLRGVNSPSLRV